MKNFFLIALVLIINQIAFTQSETDTLRLVLPFGQNEEFEIKELFASSSGNIIASLGESDRIIIYNSLTGTAIVQIFFDSLNISIDKLSLSPNGKFVLGADDSQGVIAIWRSWDGKLLKTIEGYYAEIISDNPDIIYQDNSSKVCFSQLDNKFNSELIQLSKHELFLMDKSDVIYDLSYNESDSMVVMCTKNDYLISFNIESGGVFTKTKLNMDLTDKNDVNIQCLGSGQAQISSKNKVVSIRNNEVSNIYSFKKKNVKEISNSGNFCYYSEDEKSFIWDKKRKKTFPIYGQEYGFERITSFVFIDQEKSFFTASTDGTIYSWNTENGSLNYIIESPVAGISSPKISTKSNNALVLADRFFLHEWDLITGISINHFLMDKLDLELDGQVFFSIPDIDSVLSLGSSVGDKIYLLDIKSGDIINSFQEPLEDYSMDYVNPRGEVYKNLAAIGDSVYYIIGGQQLWCAGKLKPIVENISNFLCFSPNQETFLSCDYEQKFINLRNTSSGKVLAQIPFCGEYIYNNYLTNDKLGVCQLRDKILFLDFNENKTFEIPCSSRNNDLKYISGQFMVFYGNNQLKVNNLQIGGDELVFPVSECFNFCFSENKKCFVTIEDNLIKVWSLLTNKHVYERLVLPNRNWLVKLPNSPYYMCSKDASKMLHYVTPSLKVIGFDQLDPVYNRPDIVLDSIGKYFGGADKDLVANYLAAWEKRIERLGLDKEKLSTGEIAVPNADIVNADQIEYKDGSVIIHVKANDPKYTLRRYNVLVNEVPVYGSDGVSISELNTKQLERTDTIALSIGNNKIQVSVMNELGFENFKYPTYVNYTPKNDIVGKTYYVGIGVNEFKDTEHNLKYCVKDVEDLAKVFANKKSKVETVLYTNSEVTKENILALKSYLQENTTVNDKVIISCSSHGLLDDSLNFYLATYDVDFSNPKERGLKYEELESLLDGIPARQKLLLLDACNSGENERLLVEMNKSNDIAKNDSKRGEELEIASKEVDTFQRMNELFVNVRNNTGSVIISAAGGLQSALEAIEVDGKEIKNGAFTFTVLEYLNQSKESEIKVNDLKLYVEKRVEEITKGKQKPTSRQETMEVDWVVK